MFLAKILVPEGSQDIDVGQPIMITVQEKEDVAAFANYVLEKLPSIPHQVFKEAVTPTKESVDPQTQSPVAPGDFLVNAQTVVVPPRKASTVPASVPRSTKLSSKSNSRRRSHEKKS